MDSRQALVRDLARLFVKYDLEDWQFVLNALRQGGPDLEMMQKAVDDLTTRGKRPKAAGARQDGVKEVLAEVEKQDAEKAAILKELHELVRKKEVAPRLADIRDFCVTAGIKANPPKRRDEAVVFLIRELALVEDKPTLKELLRKLPVKDRNLNDEYRGWFRMIYPDGNQG